MTALSPKQKSDMDVLMRGPKIKVPQSIEFYSFTRAIASYTAMIGENTTLVPLTGYDLFKFLNGYENNHTIRLNFHWN